MRKLIIVTAALAALLVATTTAFAQEEGQQGSITATGVLGEAFTKGPTLGTLYPLTDEASGTEYTLISDSVNLDPFVDQRVTVEGTSINNAPDAPPGINVTSIELATPTDPPGKQQPQCFLPEGCSFSGDGSDEKIVGGIGPDYAIGGGGSDTLYGLGAGDWLDGGSGDDAVRGNEGDDLVDGGSGDDLVIGNDGDVVVTVYLGSDILNGGGGDDYIYAADGTFDKVSGGPGYDVCVVDEVDKVTGCEEVRS